ncbi:hypothetical protein HYN48_07295 [Flavobacterium magnum]|uniref:Uncharacterized protein n=1 Tax=Flavobacterium magnum TaxID=2162713 RepID=A0A2S0RF87_9FLAO|nr:hypothetical protein [Flavobacterium magnum]AWA29898.1 hypothetical protein HYN48_07295 [Flavobacterium magnum]
MEVQSVDIQEPVILIRINKAYQSGFTDKELYEYTRGRWKLNPERAKKATYGIAVYKGIIREVYEITGVHPAGTTITTRSIKSNSGLDTRESLIKRFEFEGLLAPTDVRGKYLNKSVKHYFVRGNSNPINYVNL